MAIVRLCDEYLSRERKLQASCDQSFANTHLLFLSSVELCWFDMSPFAVVVGKTRERSYSKFRKFAPHGKASPKIQSGAALRMPGLRRPLEVCSTVSWLLALVRVSGVHLCAERKITAVREVP